MSILDCVRITKYNHRVVAGPAGCGNRDCHFVPGLLSAGQYAVVRDCDYINPVGSPYRGLRGPYSVDGLVYQSREAAEAECSRVLLQDRPVSNDQR